MGDPVTAAAVTAFRLQGHNLGERLELNGLLEATGRCGIQNSPPGSALLSLNARVSGLTQERFLAAVTGEKALLQTWSLRGAPFFAPTTDAAVFTTGVLPPTESALRHFLLGAQHVVDRLGMALSAAVGLTGAELPHVLAGRQLTIDPLGDEIARRIGLELPPEQRVLWDEQGPYAPGQPLGEGLVHFCLRILALQGVLCFGPRAGNQAPLVLVDEWLDGPLPAADPVTARAELLRRYLRCYGPSNRRDFAAWVGVQVGDTDAWWNLVEDELAQIEFDGRAWMLAEDLGALRSATMPTGARLLPPRDPYTQLRDRATIVDRTFHREVWRPVGDPGTVLVGGAIAGIWRPRKSGRTLTIRITAFRSLPARVRTMIEDEAEQVATLRGAAQVQVTFDSL